MAGIKFKVFPQQRNSDAKAGFYYHVQGGNGEVMCVSEQYPTLDHARRGAGDLWIAIGDAHGVDGSLTHTPFTGDSL